MKFLIFIPLLIILLDSCGLRNSNKKNENETRFDSLVAIIRTDSLFSNSLTQNSNSDSINEYGVDLLNMEYSDIIAKYEMNSKDEEDMFLTLEISAGIVERNKELNRVLGESRSKIDSLLNQSDSLFKYRKEILDTVPTATIPDNTD